MDESRKEWFVLRDLKRTNARLPAYKELPTRGVEVYTPMQWRISVRAGRRIREQVPYMSDLLFAHTCREALDPIVELTPTLQYRYVRGAGYCVPMTVGEAEMERFIHAARQSAAPRFYAPSELTPQMRGRTVRILEGPLADYEGKLVTVRGSKTRRLLVEIPGLIAVAVEVEAEYVEVM